MPINKHMNLSLIWLGFNWVFTYQIKLKFNDFLEDEQIYGRDSSQQLPARHNRLCSCVFHSFLMCPLVVQLQQASSTRAWSWAWIEFFGCPVRIMLRLPVKCLGNQTLSHHNELQFSTVMLMSCYHIAQSLHDPACFCCTIKIRWWC